jgi:predicted PurR-regulated permease PerM
MHDDREPQHEPHVVSISARTVWVVLGNTLALVALLALLFKAHVVLGWTLFASMLALALHPAVAALERRRVPRGWAVVLMLLAGIALVAITIATLVPMVVEQAQALIARAPQMLARLAQTAPVRWADQHFGIFASAEAELHDAVAGITAPALAVAAGIVSGVGAAVSIITLTAFMLLFGRDLFDRALLWMPPQSRAHAQLLAVRMRSVVAGYVVGALTVSSVGGVVMGVTVLMLGVPYFLPLGLVMVLLGVIPMIGSAIGAVLVIGITFASAGVRAAAIAAFVYLAYQQVENQLLQPLVQRRTIQMNPLLITLSVLVGASLAGPLGAILALPVAGVIQVLLSDALERRAARWTPEVEEGAVLLTRSGQDAGAEPRH